MPPELPSRSRPRTWGWGQTPTLARGRLSMLRPRRPCRSPALVRVLTVLKGSRGAEGGLSRMSSRSRGSGEGPASISRMGLRLSLWGSRHRPRLHHPPPWSQRLPHQGLGGLRRSEGDGHLGRGRCNSWLPSENVFSALLEQDLLLTLSLSHQERTLLPG